MARTAKSTAPGAAVIIKKYANRRLYNTETSAYITLEDLARMTREGRDFQVVDAKSGEDITKSVLTQIIMEAEGRGETMLPTNFLRQLITMYGNSMSSVVPHYLENAMANFQANQAKLQKAFKGAVSGGNPLAELARLNMEMFEQTMRALRPKPREDKSDARDAEVAELKAQLAALQEKIDRLDK